MCPSEPAPTTWESSTPSTSRADAAAKTKASKRIRRADQFQIFLALALLALLADAFTRPYPVAPSRDPRSTPASRPARARAGRQSRYSSRADAVAAILLAASLGGISRADNPADAVREGLRSYGKGEFDKARDSFAAAREQFEREGCRQGRDRRVRPGLRRASQGRRGAGPRMVSQGRSCPRQGPGGLGPLQPGHAVGRRGTPAGRRTAGRRGARKAPGDSRPVEGGGRFVSSLPRTAARKRPRPPRHRARAAVDQVLHRPVARPRSRETAPGNEPGRVSRIPDRDPTSVARVGQGPPADIPGRCLRRSQTRAG